jgi:hypothetical protein
MPGDGMYSKCVFYKLLAKDKLFWVEHLIEISETVYVLLGGN